MPTSNDDWRSQGQQQDLAGVILHWARWTRPRSDWDHDHCEFCWAKFMEEDLPDVLHYGYTTPNRSRWVCETCFQDFKGRFAWRVE